MVTYSSQFMNELRLWILKPVGRSSAWISWPFCGLMMPPFHHLSRGLVLCCSSMLLWTARARSTSSADLTAKKSMVIMSSLVSMSRMAANSCWSPPKSALENIDRPNKGRCDVEPSLASLPSIAASLDVSLRLALSAAVLTHIRTCTSTESPPT